MAPSRDSRVTRHARAADPTQRANVPRVGIASATSDATNGAEYRVFERNRSTKGSMIRLTVRRSGPPSTPLSTSTPGPIARHAFSITARRGWATASVVATSDPVLIYTG